MKQMVSAESSSSHAEGLLVRGRQKDESYNGSRGKSLDGNRSRSKSRGKDNKFCNYCKKDNHHISECYKLQNKEK